VRCCNESQYGKECSCGSTGSKGKKESGGSPEPTQAWKSSRIRVRKVKKDGGDANGQLKDST